MSPLHKDWPLSWKWVEESEAYWKTSSIGYDAVKTTMLHGLQDTDHPSAYELAIRRAIADL